MLSQISQGQWTTTKKNQFKLETSCLSPQVLSHTYSYIIWNAQKLSYTWRPTRQNQIGVNRDSFVNKEKGIWAHYTTKLVRLTSYGREVLAWSTSPTMVYIILRHFHSFIAAISLSGIQEQLSNHQFSLPLHGRSLRSTNLSSNPYTYNKKIFWYTNF